MDRLWHDPVGGLVIEPNECPLIGNNTINYSLLQDLQHNIGTACNNISTQYLSWFITDICSLLHTCILYHTGIYLTVNCHFLFKWNWLLPSCVINFSARQCQCTNNSSKMNETLCNVTLKYENYIFFVWGNLVYWYYTKQSHSSDCWCYFYGNRLLQIEL